MINLPTDIILHILSFLPLSDTCHLLTSTANSSILYFYIKQTLLARVKQEAWSLILYTPATYFAILCNRDMLALSNPIARLVCVGYNTSSDYLLFETRERDPYQFELSDDLNENELEFQSMRIYCSQWVNLFKDDDKWGHTKLCWHEGEQTKQVGQHLWIKYKCTKKVVMAAEEGCKMCKYNHRCNKHAVLFSSSSSSSSSSSPKRLLQIEAIRVSLDWIKQGLIA